MRGEVRDRQVKGTTFIFASLLSQSSPSTGLALCPIRLLRLGFGPRKSLTEPGQPVPRCIDTQDLPEAGTGPCAGNSGEFARASHDFEILRPGEIERWHPAGEIDAERAHGGSGELEYLQVAGSVVTVDKVGGDLLVFAAARDRADRARVNRQRKGAKHTARAWDRV